MCGAPTRLPRGRAPREQCSGTPCADDSEVGQRGRPWRETRVYWPHSDTPKAVEKERVTSTPAGLEDRRMRWKEKTSLTRSDRSTQVMSRSWSWQRTWNRASSVERKKPDWERKKHLAFVS